MKSTLFLLCVLLFSSTVLATPRDSRTIRLCTEDVFWAPYTFAVDSKITGHYITVVEEAFRALPYKLEITIQPWLRCIAAGSTGRIDGVLGGIYTAERAKNFHYPPDAGKGKPSKWELSYVSEALVVLKNRPLNWHGDLAKIPSPVGVPVGYVWVEKLRAKGLDVQTSVHYDDLLQMLLRGHVNSVAMTRQLAQFFVTQPALSDQIKFDPTPLEQWSVHLFMSKASVSAMEAQEIWNAIADVKANKTFMAAMQQEIARQTKVCLEDKSRC